MRAIDVSVLVAVSISLASSSLAQDQPSEKSKYLAARANPKGADAIKTVVVDLSRTKRGLRGFDLRRWVQVSERGGHVWTWKDSRPSIFGLVINRTSKRDLTLEAPSMEKKRCVECSWITDLYDILFLGFPLHCDFTVEKADRKATPGTRWLLLLTPCVRYHEFFFEISNETGLPLQLIEEYAPPRDGRPTGGTRLIENRIVYLGWDTGSWRMPTRLRREYYFGKKSPQASSEYAVFGCIDCPIREGFFSEQLMWDMSPESWRVDTARSGSSSPFQLETGSPR